MFRAGREQRPCLIWITVGKVTLGLGLSRTLRWREHVNASGADWASPLRHPRLNRWHIEFEVVRGTAAMTAIDLFVVTLDGLTLWV
jgi:hypothetical protein